MYLAGKGVGALQKPNIYHKIGINDSKTNGREDDIKIRID